MPTTQERIVIALWQGYVSSCFYARPPEADVALAVSPAFRSLRLPWERRRPLGEQPRAVRSLRALEGRLEDEGWEPVHGPARGPWYALRFRRDDLDDFESVLHPGRPGEGAGGSLPAEGATLRDTRP